MTESLMLSRNAEKWQEHKKRVWEKVEKPIRDSLREAGVDLDACEICGDFIDHFNGRIDRSYCSPACRQKAYRLQRKAM